MTCVIPQHWCVVLWIQLFISTNTARILHAWLLPFDVIKQNFSGEGSGALNCSNFAAESKVIGGMVYTSDRFSIAVLTAQVRQVYVYIEAWKVYIQDYHVLAHSFETSDAISSLGTRASSFLHLCIQRRSPIYPCDDGAPGLEIASLSPTSVVGSAIGNRLCDLNYDCM